MVNIWMSCKKAKISCENSWIESKNHFTDASKMVWLGF